MLHVHCTLISGFLYFEILLIMMMVTPIFGPYRWYRLSQIGLFGRLWDKISIIFFIWCLYITYFGLHATSTMSQQANELKGDPLKVIAAQRNFHIAGLAGFLMFVISKMSQMIAHVFQSEANILKAISRIQNTLKGAETAFETMNEGRELTLELCALLRTQLDYTTRLLKKERYRVWKLEKAAAKRRLIRRQGYRSD